MFGTRHIEEYVLVEWFKMVEKEEDDNVIDFPRSIKVTGENWTRSPSIISTTAKLKIIC